MAGFVRESVGKGGIEVTGEGGVPRPARYGDFAVLLKTMGRQYLLERHFRAEGIPYSCAEPAGLFYESPVNDLARALAAAADPDDAFSLAAFLASPFARCGPESIARATLALASGAPDPLGEALAAAEEGEAERLRKASAIMARLRSRADAEPIASLLCRLWYDEGLRLSILARTDLHPYLEHFDWAHALACRADARGLSLASFCAELSESLGGLERVRELAVPAEASDGVRIMSVHKSKGLEFPIVVLPWVDGGRGRNDFSLWHRTEHGLCVRSRDVGDPGAAAEDPFVEAAKGLERAKAQAELKRLFYVACTRAVDHLFFFGVEPSGDGGGAAPAEDGATRFRDLMGPLHRSEAGSYVGASAEGGATAVELARPPAVGSSGRNRETGAGNVAGAYRERIETRFARELPSIAASALATAFEGEAIERLGALPIDDLLSMDAANPASRGAIAPSEFGELCHAYAAERFGARGAIDAALARLAIPAGSSLDRLRKEAARLADAFVATELGALVARGRTEAEAPFALSLVGEVLVTGRVDLIAEFPDRVLVVDFKSDGSIRRDARGSCSHEAQLGCYALAASRTYGKPAEAWIHWLRAGKSERLSDAASDETRLADAAREALRRIGHADAAATSDKLDESGVDALQ
jgi:ATP-dependent helicase/nuclease subunit A